MRQRCLNPNNGDYGRYGGRGVEICPRWDAFENFLADMGEPASDATIDRIDNDGNYEPSNCRWASRLEQGRNRETSRLVTVHGETACLSEWAARRALSVKTVQSRLRYGWSMAQALGLSPRPPPRQALRGESHGCARLTAEDVLEIRQEGREVTTRSLAKRYSVTESAIYRVRKGLTWKHLLEDA